MSFPLCSKNTISPSLKFISSILSCVKIIFGSILSFCIISIYSMFVFVTLDYHILCLYPWPQYQSQYYPFHFCFLDFPPFPQFMGFVSRIITVTVSGETLTLRQTALVISPINLSFCSSVFPSNISTCITGIISPHVPFDCFNLRKCT